MSGRLCTESKLDDRLRPLMLVASLASAVALPLGAQAVPVGTRASLSLSGFTNEFSSGGLGTADSFSVTPGIAHAGTEVSQVSGEDGALGSLASVHSAGEATAGIGRLRARLTGAAVARATAAPDAPFTVSTATVTSRAVASWSDTLTLFSATPGLLQLNGTLHVGGTLAKGLTTPTSANNGEVGIQIAVSSNNLLVTGTHFEDDLPPRETITPIPENVPVSFTVRAGVPFEVFFTLTIEGAANLAANLPIEATAEYRGIAEAGFIGDFSHTLDWGGITSVTDAAGNPVVGDWRIQSLSGFDYLLPTPVPLPPSLALSIGGLVVTFCMQRRHERAA